MLSFLAVVAFLCGISAIVWAIDGRLAWDPSREGNWRLVDIASAIGCLLLSYVLWRIARRRRLMRGDW